MARTRQPLDCHERALGLLAVRPRSRRELERRLRAAGFEAEEVRDELSRLEAVGLVDDEAFARQVVEHELSNRRAGSRAVVARLTAKGVDRETIERTLAEAGTGAGEEEARALELAGSRARRLASLPAETAYGRLVPFLVRRGYDGATARAAAARALRLGGDLD